MPKFRSSPWPLAALILTAFMLVVWSPSAGAADQTPPAKTHEQCVQDHETCRADCEAKHAADQAKKAACHSVCAARFAACDANAAYEKARPWLEEKARQTKKFLEELLKDMPGATGDGKTPTPVPAPAPKNPANI